MFARIIDQREQGRRSTPPWTRFAVPSLTLCVLCLGSGPAAAGGEESAAANALTIQVDRSQDRQVIDGFGGSLAFWGADPDEESLRYIFEDLGATIVRVPGEVSSSGAPDEYRAVLERVARIAPDARVVVAFWQPRSRSKPQISDWLDDLSTKGYALKASMREEWAAEMVSRLETIRNHWGINVAAVSVQNEPNYSAPGLPTCRWDPAALAEFISRSFAPRLKRAGLSMPLAAPEVGFLLEGISEVERFHPVSASEEVTIFSYHMYDSYREGETPVGFAGLRAKQVALGRYLEEYLPGKRIWMTETTGAQWNTKEWHTLGWRPGMDEHDKAMAAARYMHTALVDAQCSAFLWWGLTYSVPPPSLEGEERQKFRDEGLILVGDVRKDGVHPYVEKTPKYYAFKQFAHFIRPGWVRLKVKAPPTRLVAAFRSPDSRRLAVVVLNPDKSPLEIEPRISGAAEYRLTLVSVTDRERRCEAMPWTGSLTGESITTLVYQAE